MHDPLNLTQYDHLGITNTPTTTTTPRRADADRRQVRRSSSELQGPTGVDRALVAVLVISVVALMISSAYALESMEQLRQAVLVGGGGHA